MTAPSQGAALRRRAARQVALVGLGWVVGCRPGVDGALIDVRAELSERVPTVVHVRWQSAETGRSYVEYGLDGALDLRTPAVEDGALDHVRALLGLKAGRSTSFRAVTETARGEVLRSAVATIDVPLPPPELPAFYASAADEGAMQPGGFVLTSLLLEGPSWAIILDRDGDLVWYYSAGEGFGIPTARPSRDGASVMILTNDLDLESDRGAVLRVALDGGSLASTRLVASHHDFVELPDGRIAWPAAELRDVAIGDAEFSVVGDQILALPEGAEGEPEVLFNLFDDYAPVWPPCDHFDDTVFGLDGAKDWSHVNSLMFDEAEGDLLLVSKNFDARLRVDLQTGALIEQIGGRYATRPFAEDATPWSHGHMSHSYDGGLLMFDNGYHHSPADSRVVEYAWDSPTDTIHEVWSYTDPGGRFITLLGDARKLPNGDVLASWTSAGFLSEITPEGQVVWQLDTEAGHNFGRVTWLEDLYAGAAPE